MTTPRQTTTTAPFPAAGAVAAAPPGPRLHLAHVEGMRALAALVVLVNHGYAQVWVNRGEPEGPLSLFTYSMVLGHLAVSVFIVISGFCLMLPVVRGGGVLRGGARLFFQRRCRRILPPYYAAFALSLLLIWTLIGDFSGTLWDASIQIRRQDLLAHLLLVQDVYGTGKVNYAFWSIATERQIYFFFPLLVWGWRRFGARVVVPIAAAVGYALAIGFADTRLARAHAQFLGLFTLGMLAATIVHAKDGIYQRLRMRFPWAALGAAATLVTAALTIHWGWKEAREHFVALDGAVAVVALSLLVLTSRSDRGLFRALFASVPLAAIGAFSYSLYLIHAPLLQLFWQYAVRPLALSLPAQFALVASVGMPAVVGASYLFYRACEKPFISAPVRSDAAANALLVPSP